MSYYCSDFFTQKELQKICSADGETIAKALAVLSENYPIQHFVALFYHFNEFVDQMIEHFKQIFPLIVAYHAAHKEETREILQRFLSKENQYLVQKSILILEKNTLISLDRQTYSLCYINPGIIKTYSQDRRYIFILGCNWAIYFSKTIDYRHVTMQSIMTTMGHPVKIEIINELRKSELSVTQLSNRLQLARTSLSRYIKDLQEELAILKVRKSGPEIYYRLNEVYFRYAQKVINQYLDNTILDMEKLL